MPANSILDDPIKTLLSMLCSLIEALSRAHSTGGGGGGFNDFKCGTLIDRSQRVITASVAVKELIQKYKVWCGTLRFALHVDAWVCVLLQGLGFVCF